MMNRLTNAEDRVTNGWNMKKLLAILFCLLAGPAWAQAPVEAPSVQLFLGPSLGNVWQREGSYIFGFNAQTGTTYTVVPADIGKVISLSNAGAIAVTLPQAGTAGFEANKCFYTVTIGAGTATYTPTTSTINAGATKAYATGVGGQICSNGTNYLAW